MSSPEISDDDDGFLELEHPRMMQTSKNNDVILLSDDDEDTENYYTSDEESQLPAVNLLTKKSTVIKNLFPSSKSLHTDQSAASTSYKKVVPQTIPSPQKPKPPGFVRMIGGVQVTLPVNPYGSQVALISQLIKAIKNGQNCLLESPTGSGKTLALLCGALAWQQHEKDRITQIQAQQHISNHPGVNAVDGAANYIGSPVKNQDYCQEISFKKTIFGEKSIYDKPSQNGREEGISSYKRQEPLHDCSADSPMHGQVMIHKKRRLDSSDTSGEGSKTTSPETPATPEKRPNAPQHETPQHVRLPTIYYGARTHKQLQQVVKEFARTHYCGNAPMSVLSSREYSCIREFDKIMWGTKNDMCRGCIKKTNTESTPKKLNKDETNCKFFDNRQALNHKSLPPAFDLEDLVTAGHEMTACPYYAARAMAVNANIVFCPYNYLIEPGIRNSMQIDLHDNIVVIDEAHNIEDICRDAATFTFTRDSILASIKELEIVTNYRYSNQDVMTSVDHLLKTLKSWDDWFANQIPLVSSKPVTNNEAVHMWEVEHFVQSLNNHNIGQPHYNDFHQSVEVFCTRLRESPGSLFGATQASGTLFESLDTVLGYLFRESGKYKDDFKPALIRNVNVTGGIGNWRSSQFNQTQDKSIEKESLSFRLMCMSPAVVFEGLKTAKCIILASGTLTPLISLHSELGTTFPLQISPNHIIKSDRVWIGTLATCPNGRQLECNSRGTDQVDIQDGIGQAVLWVCQVTPNGVLCFLPSYMLMNKLYTRWQETGLWNKLTQQKHVFKESRVVRDHNDIMDDYYKYVSTDKGALLFAVYRGKVSEGMDFKDHQARAVITVGVPYPNTFDMAVKEKMNYNDKYAKGRNLLSSREWLRVQAYRALNQAVGRCVRHGGDWGAVLLVDSRFTQPYYTEHLSKWVRNFLGNNNHTYESLVNSPNSLESFMQNMRIRENEEV